MRFKGRLCDQSGDEKLQLFVDLPAKPRLPSAAAEKLLLEDRSGWIVVSGPIQDFTIPCPGRYSLRGALEGDEEVELGHLDFVEIDAPPLTEEVVAAAKSSPLAMSSMIVEVRCPACSDGIEICVALERPASDELQGTTWYRDLPDEFRCGCDRLRVDLRGYREKGYVLALPAEQLHEDTAEGVRRLYQNRELADLLRRFRLLMDKAKNEEEVQKFLEQNLVLLAFLSPIRLFKKPSILTSFKADFAALNSSRELVLVEIEPPGIRLLKADGDTAQPLFHAVDQVRNWLHKIEDHRSAVLEEMRLNPKHVARISGLVIAGRDVKVDPQKLRALRSRFDGQVRFMTYDDVYRALAMLFSTLPSPGAL